jgi:hypothetical protein
LRHDYEHIEHTADDCCGLAEHLNHVVSLDTVFFAIHIKPDNIDQRQRRHYSRSTSSSAPYTSCCTQVKSCAIPYRRRYASFRAQRCHHRTTGTSGPSGRKRNNWC